MKIITIYGKGKRGNRTTVDLCTLEDEEATWPIVSSIMSRALRIRHMDYTGKEAEFGQCFHNAKNETVSLVIAGDTHHCQLRDIPSRFKFEGMLLNREIELGIAKDIDNGTNI